MATCGKCQATNVPVAHVRACYALPMGQALSRSNFDQRQATPAPTPQPGNVLVIDSAHGLWLVQAHATEDRVLCRRVDEPGPAIVWPLHQIEILFPHISAAKAWQSQSMIVDHGARCARIDHHPAHGQCPGRKVTMVPSWGKVNELRAEVARHLVRKEGKKLVGYFAVHVEGVVKFYRVKKMIEGNWAGKVFVDAQASDDYYPVRSPETLAGVLTAIASDPAAAALLYANELNRCSRCGRTLTDETSRAVGMGPECRSK